MTTPIADQAQRDEALNPTRSFIVQAPAGSGKTELLIRRYLVLLERVEKPEEIVAITFTKKAAAEMRKRVLERKPEIAALSHRLRIMTIDAFCASLTRQMPVVARFGAQPEIETDAGELYLDAAGRTLATLDPAVVRLLAHLDNDVATATTLLASMLARRDQWLRKTGAAPTREELETTLAAERERLLARARVFFPDASAELAAQLLTKARTWRKKVARAQEFAGNDAALEALSALLDMPPAHYSQPQWAALSAILDLLAPALAQLLVVFSERGAVDFTEVAHGALRALGDPEAPTDLLLAMDARVRHILVDEFQDTSQSQWELLERLTAGWEPGDGRTLMAVGDPMQSIYRFRDAEVSLFLHARREGLANLPLESLTLSTNFRSQAGIVGWVNDFFARALPQAEDETTGAVAYTPSTAHHAAKPGAAVQWHGFYDRASEAQRVVELVRSAPKKAAILVRNRTHLDEIVPALKAAGLPYRAVEIEPLGERQVVQDLYALARALSHPADRIAWLAVLRAPWCGLDLAELAALCEGQGEATVWDLIREAAGPPRLVRLRDALRPEIDHRLRGTLRDSVERAWLALGGPACVADATDLEDAETFLDALSALETAGAIDDMALLEEKLEKLWALPDVNAGPEAVEIMTIHKAKGLEFDTVILPGLDRKPRNPDRPLFAWRSLPSPARGRGAGGEGASLLLAPIDETGGAKEPLYKYVRDLDRESEDIEAGRLFYVAATRAISQLHLTACAKADEDGNAKRPVKRSLLYKGWFEAEAYFGPAPSTPLAPLAGRGAGGEGRPDTLRRLPASFTTPPPPPPPAVAWAAPPEGRDEEEQIEFSWVGETARHVGTVVHRWLQRIAEDELRGWDEARVESLRPRYARELERRGVPPAELEGAVALVVRSLTNSIKDERGRWILGPHPEAKSEYRVRAAVEGGVRTYVMDRVFTTREEERWVVDYKISVHEGGSIEEFLDEQRKRYAQDLQTYASVVKDSNMGLYFPIYCGWRESLECA
ncbi:MAG: UvrD-helicase domain-containing protein [Burkholderiales bacterium]